MSDVRMELRFKNQRLYDVIFGPHRSISEFCRAHGVPRHRSMAISDLLSFRKPPYRRIKVKIDKQVTYCLRMTPIARWLCDVSGLPQDELFPDNLYKIKFPREFVKVVPANDLLTSITGLAPIAAIQKAPDAPGFELGPAATAINSILRTLEPREERVIKLHFGLDGEEEHTLDEIGKMMRVGGERIRQIEARALRKLRHPSRGRRIRHFVE